MGSPIMDSYIIQKVICGKKLEVVLVSCVLDDTWNYVGDWVKRESKYGLL